MTFLQGQMSELPEFERRNPFHRANSLAELLCFNDLDFVRCAYVTVLGRQPDLPGQEHYVEQIRAGFSKYDVLGRLRMSPEAKHHDPGIAGFDRALKRAAWERRPLLGALSRLLRADADGQSRTDKMLRALGNAVWVNHCDLQAISERLSIMPAATGRQASLATSTPSLRNESQQSDTVRGGQDRNIARTPDLDHLRKKGVVGRYVGDVAP